MFMSHRIHLFAFTQMLLSHEFFLLSSFALYICIAAFKSGFKIP